MNILTKLVAFNTRKIRFNSLFKYLLVAILALPLISVVANDDQKSSKYSNPLDYYLDFAGKTIKTDKKIIDLIIPLRAEDAAFVPLKIEIGFSQKELFIKKIWVFIDRNPVPLAGVFEFGKASVHADLAFRIRVNEHSYVRAVVQTENDEFFASSHYVKATGGCSAPVDSGATDKDNGKIRLIKDNYLGKNSILTQLNIRHLNRTGFQMNQVTRLRPLAHFITNIKVSINNEKVFSAQTNISISEDPSFKFYAPKTYGDAKVKIEVADSKNIKFTDTFALQ